MPQDKIVIKGAREHNLKNVDVTIPRDKLVVFTGRVSYTHLDVYKRQASASTGCSKPSL